MKRPVFLRHQQAGQALAEFLVALAALLPLWLAVCLIGKYAGLQQSAVQASRYAAFQHATQPQASRLEDQLRARFFLQGDGLPGNPRGEIRSDDGVESFSSNPPSFATPAWWRDPGGDPLLPDPRRVTLSLETRPADAALQAADAPMQAAFGLPAQAIHVASVEVALATPLRREGAFWHIGATTAASADSAHLRGSQGVRSALTHHPAVSFGVRALSVLQAVVAVPMAWLEDTAPTMPCLRVEALPRDRLEGGPYHPGACR